MTLRFYNSLTKSKDAFVPRDAKNVGMYVCGPTVYDFAHIGNARPAIVFDVLFRLLRHEYGDAHVTYVRNITDVDDKINARAAERGISIRDLTEDTARIYNEDVAALGCLPPSISPRATFLDGYVSAVIERVATAQALYSKIGMVTLAGFDEYGNQQWQRTCRAGPLVRRLDPNNPSTLKWYGRKACQYYIGRDPASLTSSVQVEYAV